MDEDRLIQELRTLRHGRGVSVPKMQYCLALFEVLGTTSPEVAYERLLECLEDLGPGPDAEALRDAFGVGADPGPTLEVRRYRLAARLDVTPKTLQYREDLAIQELARLLFATE